MQTKIIYGAYVAFLLVFLIPVAVTPLIAFSDPGTANALYRAYSYTCHQKLSRSLCYFGNATISDCTDQAGRYVADDRNIAFSVREGAIGYKFPICARDIGIYCAMLLGALVYPFFFRLDEKKILPPVLLVLALVPMGLDGGLQLLSDMGINIIGQYESTNLLRLLTGGLAGFVASFYVIPILNRMFG